MLQLLVPNDRPGDLETGGPEQPDVFQLRSADRHHRLGPEQAVVAHLAAGRVEDVVADEAVGADRNLSQPEGRAGDVGVDHGKTIGNQGSLADLAEERRVVLLLDPEVGAGLIFQRYLVADGPQVIDDIGAIAEQEIEEV